MGRKRTVKANKGLPLRWRWIRSAIYFDVPAGQEVQWDDKRTFRLGSSLAEAYQTWASRLQPTEAPKRCRTIGILLDQFQIEKVPEFSPPYQELCRSSIVRLKSVFAEKNPKEITPHDVQQYLVARSKKTKNSDGKSIGGKIIANREIEILQNAFSWAVFDKGYLSKHPFKDAIRFQTEKSRDRYIEDWEIAEMMKVTSNRRKGSFHSVKAYIKIKLLTGMSKGDLLRLTKSDLKEDGIHIQRHKVAHSSGRRTTYLWSDELRAAVDEAIRVRPVISPFLFCKNDGTGYFNETTGNPDGWDSIWGRFKTAVFAQTKITENFTDHDIRAKTGSDAETLEEAAKMLSHASTAITRKHYRRKPDQVATGTK